ncbi:MAG: acyl-CoA dehydrogenase family protein, partial [Acidimicrobiia bacterium]
MTFTAEHHDFRRLVREFVEKEVDPHVDVWEAAREMPLHEIFAEMGKLGLLGLEYSTEYGGQGADHLFTVILAEEFGRAAHGALGMALGVQVNMATPSLHDHGSEELKRT